MSLDVMWQQGHPAFSGAAEPAWLAARRVAALSSFQAAGLPGPRHPAWHYTRARVLVEGVGGRAAAVTPGAGEAWRVPEAAFELVIVDGVVDAARSRLGEAGGVTVTAISDVLAGRAGGDAERALVEARLGMAGAGADGLRLLHAAFVQDGVVVRAAPGAHLDGLVHVLVVSTTGVSHPVVIVDVGRAGQVDVLESHVASGEGTSLCDAVTHLSLGDGARATWSVLGLRGPGAARLLRGEAVLGRDARLHAHVSWLGGRATRSELDVRHAGPGSEVVLDGAYLTAGDAHVDNRTIVTHAAPRCATRETYRGVLGGRSRGVFDGTVVVEVGADGTDAAQSCRNLLVSPDAEADAMPRLEIYADDVKCSHGTTVGQLDAAQLTYLRSRGVPMAEARAMLTAAFVQGHVDAAPHPEVRRRLAEHAEGRLAELIGEGL